jgi:hypothetical protein
MQNEGTKAGKEQKRERKNDRCFAITPSDTENPGKEEGGLNVPYLRHEGV